MADGNSVAGGQGVGTNSTSSGVAPSMRSVSSVAEATARYKRQTETYMQQNGGIAAVAAGGDVKELMKQLKESEKKKSSAHSEINGNTLRSIDKTLKLLLDEVTKERVILAEGAKVAAKDKEDKEKTAEEGVKTGKGDAGGATDQGGHGFGGSKVAPPGEGGGLLSGLLGGFGKAAIATLIGGELIDIFRRVFDDKGAVASDLSKSVLRVFGAPVNAFMKSLSKVGAGIEMLAAKAGGAAEKAAIAVAKPGATVAEKAAIKAGEHIAAKGGVELAGVGLKTAGKIGAKVLPGIGAVLDTATAIDRARQGDWAGAGLDAVSAVASFVPVVGTAAAVGIQGYQAYRDISGKSGYDMDKTLKQIGVEKDDAKQVASSPATTPPPPAAGGGDKPATAEAKGSATGNGPRVQGATGDASTLLDFIGQKESGGDYNSIVGIAKKIGPQPSKPLSEMTIAEVEQWQQATNDAQKKAGIDGKNRSTAAGKYQMIFGTLSTAVGMTGMSRDEKFSPENQDKLARWLLKDRGYDDYKAGRKSLGALQNDLAKEWASMPTTSGAGAYDGVGTNKALTSSSAFAAAIQGKPAQAVPAAPNQGTQLARAGNGGGGTVNVVNAPTNVVNNNVGGGSGGPAQGAVPATTYGGALQHA